MSYSVSVQLTRMANITESGRRENNFMFGYRIYDDAGTTEYINSYDSFDDLINDMNSLNVFDSIKSNHPLFWYTVYDEGGVNFNGTDLDISNYNNDNLYIYDEDEDYDEDDEEESIGDIYNEVVTGLLDS